MMKRLLCSALVLLAAVAAAPALAEVEVGMKAPDFEAESTMGTIRLSDYLGKKHVLLAVYYKDFTGG